MDDADPSSSRNGRSSGEGCSSSDFDSGHVSGIAKANRKRGRSRGHTSTAARGGKRRKPAANSRAAAAPAHPRRGRLQLSELPGGYIFIKGMATRGRAITVPRAFSAKCFPDLQQQHGQQQQVQLRVTVDAQPGADSGPAEDEATTAAITCCRPSRGSRLQFCLVGADAMMRRYANHTVIGMSGVRGSDQLTLHLQAPAAAAAAQQAAEAAAAAAEADPARWQEHDMRRLLSQAMSGTTRLPRAPFYCFGAVES
uniref:Uncharacterized protein n=1 Tax=Tetradesmus obliquus TaxID=3088 RepID=A0A383W7E3_TETOB|eukprot:jgi/Sobl393_1/11693/SZX73548.1